MDKDQIAKVLKEIQESVPNCYTKNLFKIKKKTPEMKFLMEETIKVKKERGTEEDLDKARQMQNLIDIGTFDREEVEVDVKVAKRYDRWMEKQIQKAIADGRLPPREKMKKDPYIKHLNQVYEQNKKGNLNEADR